MRPDSFLGMSILAVAMATPCNAQEMPELLEITSPAHMEIVSPGQTLTVTVTSKVPAKVDAVILSNAGIMGLSDSERPTPARISIVIPKDFRPRTYMLTAWGETSSGERVTSKGRLIAVELPDMPAVIEEREFPEMPFDSRGSRIPLCILARFQDGRVVEVTESTYMSYSSSDPRVATVSKYGMVTSADAGAASIVATYRRGSQSVRATIQVTVSGAGFAISPGELVFGNQAVGTSSVPRHFTVTNQSDQPLEIISVEVNGDFVATSACGKVVMPKAACRIDIVFKPTEPGERPGSLTLYNGSTSADVMPLSGIGVRQ